MYGFQSATFFMCIYRLLSTFVTDMEWLVPEQPNDPDPQGNNVTLFTLNLD